MQINEADRQFIRSALLDARQWIARDMPKIASAPSIAEQMASALDAKLANAYAMLAEE